MAVDRHVAVLMNPVEHGLVLMLIAHGSALKALVLQKAVAILLRRADADRVKAVHAALGQVAVHLHAGHDQQAGFRRKIAVVVDAVVGQREKIVAIPGVQADDLLRAALPVRARGMAMQAALEHGVSGGLECLLANHDNTSLTSNGLSTLLYHRRSRV